jgi:SAM-dependent methyltransferase
MLGANGTLLLGDAEDLPFEGGVFDVVFSTGLLEHFEDPSNIVQEMVRVLKSQGLFWSDIVPSKFSLLRAFDGLRFRPIRGKNSIFERSFTKAEIVSLLRSAGILHPTVSSGSVFPPLWFPGLSRLRLYRRLHAIIATRLRPMWSRFEGTRAADLLGFYYLCYGNKE